MRRQPHRLPEAHYVGRIIVSLTLCEADRQCCFAQPDVLASFSSRLENVCAKFGCSAPIFTLMADHVHLMLLGLTDESRPLDTVVRLKIDTSRDFGMGAGRPRWQRSFYDHIVRGGNWEKHARYIALNPVHAGLCASADAWPFTGSVGYDLKNILLDALGRRRRGYEPTRDYRLVED